MAERADKEILWAGKYIRVVRRGTWEYVERTNVTGIVGMAPVTDDGKLVLVEQYRTPVGDRVIELPAGLVGDVPGEEHEALETAARRELEEETGYRAARLHELFTGTVSAGLSDEQMTYYLATGLEKVGPGGGDDSEDITVHEVPLGEVVDWLEARRRLGAIIDVKVYAVLYACLPLGSG
jgi:ADP-ribose diphosphatase